MTGQEACRELVEEKLLAVTRNFFCEIREMDTPLTVKYVLHYTHVFGD